MAGEEEVKTLAGMDEESSREDCCFTDKRNRVWQCKISGYRMYLFGNKGITLETFNNNKLTIGQLMDLIYISCESQATKRRETKETFLDLLEGDVFDDAMEAVGDALVNFFRSPRAEKAKAKALAEEEKAEAEQAAAESAGSQDQETTKKTESGTGETTST